MAKPPLVKRTTLYEIKTTNELEKVIFHADKTTIIGSFVEFEPYQCILSNGSTTTEMDGITLDDITLILPERVITQIVHRKKK